MDIEVKAVCLVLCFLYSVAYFGHQSDNNFLARSISRHYDCEAFVHAHVFSPMNPDKSSITAFDQISYRNEGL